jgi:hypothetical protein
MSFCRRIPFLLLLTAFIAGMSPPVFADAGYQNAANLSFTGSSLPEAKLDFAESVTFPFLRGQGPLTAGNTIKTTLTASLTPISLDGIVTTVVTPIAFFQLLGGFQAGSGWNISLFGSDVYGIGINRPQNGKALAIDGAPFDGVIWKAWMGATVQFDLAAVIPGDWNHVVFQSTHQINYGEYSRAGADDSWIQLNDGGENRNGWYYTGNLLLGYQMPLFLNTVGLMAELRTNLYDTPNGSAWGDDLGQWTFTALANSTVTERLSVAVLGQFHTIRTYDTKDQFYQYRKISEDNPVRLQFFRVAAVINYTLW